MVLTSSPASVSARGSAPAGVDSDVGTTVGVGVRGIPAEKVPAASEENIGSMPLQRATTEDMDANDKLVSFLSQTGSILELAKMLDGEDDAEGAGGEDDDMEWMRKEMEKMKVAKAGIAK